MVTNAKEGNANAYAARIMFDWTELLHLEASFALSEKAGGIAGQTSYKFNTTIGTIDPTVFSFTAQYAINNMFEPTIKHIQATSTKGTGALQTELGNSYLGLNIYLNPFNTKMDKNSKRKRNMQKLVLNYIIASEDTVNTTTPWNGMGGYKDNACIFQYQVGF